jgi:hypothetical protein
MGFLGKLFGRRDDLGLDDLKLDKGFSEPPMEKSMPSFEQSMTMQGMSATPYGGGGDAMDKQRSYGFEQEIKLLSSKMDTLIAKMDNMNQRIANLERIAIEAQK